MISMGEFSLEKGKSSQLQIGVVKRADGLCRYLGDQTATKDRGVRFFSELRLPLFVLLLHFSSIELRTESMADTAGDRAIRGYG